MGFEIAGYQLLPVLPELVLAVGSMVLLMLGAYRGPQTTGLVTALAVGLLAVTGVLICMLPDGKLTTFGTSFIIRKRLVATVGCSFPVTGPRPFDVEAIALLNFYYGRSGMSQPWPMPPPER